MMGRRCRAAALMIPVNLESESICAWDLLDHKKSCRPLKASLKDRNTRCQTWEQTCRKRGGQANRLAGWESVWVDRRDCIPAFQVYRRQLCSPGSWECSTTGRSRTWPEDAGRWNSMSRTVSLPTRLPPAVDPGSFAVVEKRHPSSRCIWTSRSSGFGLPPPACERSAFPETGSDSQSRQHPLPPSPGTPACARKRMGEHRQRRRGAAYYRRQPTSIVGTRGGREIFLDALMMTGIGTKRPSSFGGR